MIYIDNNYKCYAAPADGLRAVETTFFDGKCAAYIEGYRFIPSGETWTREDGKVFSGEMASPWKEWHELNAAQQRYEQEQLAQYKNALEVMGVEV